MFYSERQAQLYALLAKEKKLTVHELAQRLYTSEATVRRDLDALEKQGKVKRTFGGAVPAEAGPAEVPLFYRQSQNVQAKIEIAKAAAAHVRDGATVFLDSSSTAAHLVPFLTAFRDLTVITNSPQTSIALAKLDIRTYCTGGILLRKSFSYVGGMAADFLDTFRADAVFFSCRGYSPEEGLITESTAEEAFIKKKMIANAKAKIFLCDKSKYGKVFPHVIARADVPDVIITEKE